MFSLIVAAAWKVLLASVILGAGLPAVFAGGVRALAMGGPSGTAGGSASGTSTTTGPSPLGRVLAGICFLIVLAGVVLGVTFVVVSGQGKVLDFSHVFPTIESKS